MSDIVEMSSVKEAPRFHTELLHPGRMAKIFVGKEKAMWTVHEDLLSQRVPHFEEAASVSGGLSHSPGSHVEGKELTFEKEDPVAFGNFIQWLHGIDIKCTYARKKHGQKAFRVWY